MSRLSARGQQLPPHEVELLNTLDKDATTVRVYDLFQAGWSLQTIGDSLLPRRPKTTIRTWVQRMSPALEQKRIDAPIPQPKIKEGEKKSRKDSPGIQPDTLEIIQELAPTARAYRARMARTSAAAVANDRLTALCILQHQNGVSIKELAQAAGVTYRAMYKRIKL